MHKSIEKQSSIPCVKGYEELDAVNSRGTRPFVFRKGKNVVKQLMKEESTRADFMNLLERFRTDFNNGAKDKFQMVVKADLGEKIRTEVLQLIPGETAWPFISRSLLRSTQLLPPLCFDAMPLP